MDPGTGKQAEVLNKVIDELLDDDHPMGEVKLKEVLGHTPRQVCAVAPGGWWVGGTERGTESKLRGYWGAQHVREDGRDRGRPVASREHRVSNVPPGAHRRQAHMLRFRCHFVGAPRPPSL